MSYSVIWRKQSQAKFTSNRIINTYFTTHWFLTKYTLKHKSGYATVVNCVKDHEHKACEIITLHRDDTKTILWHTWLPFTIHHTCEGCAQAWDEKMLSGDWTSK